MKYNQFPPSARQDFFRQFLSFKQTTTTGARIQFNVPKIESDVGNLDKEDKVEIAFYNEELGSPFTLSGYFLASRGGGKVRISIPRKFNVPDELNSGITQTIIKKESSPGVLDVDTMSSIMSNMMGFAVFKREIVSAEDFKVHMPNLESEASGIEDGDSINVTGVNMTQDNVGPLRDQATRRTEAMMVRKPGGNPRGPKNFVGFSLPERAVKLNGWDEGDIVQYIVRKARLG